MRALRAVGGVKRVAQAFRCGACGATAEVVVETRAASRWRTRRGDARMVRDELERAHVADAGVIVSYMRCPGCGVRPRRALVDTTLHALGATVERLVFVGALALIPILGLALLVDPLGWLALVPIALFVFAVGGAEERRRWREARRVTPARTRLALPVAVAREPVRTEVPDREGGAIGDAPRRLR